MDKIKVLIIDDSAVIRSIVKELLLTDESIEVVGEAKDPFVARDLIKELNPDVLTLDVEMPKMDGITFLKNLMRLRPMPVVMLSTLTTKGAEITFKALELGAVDFIAKPSFEQLNVNKDLFKDNLIEKVKSAVTVDQKSFRLKQQLQSPDEVTVHAFTGCKRMNHLVAIGSSTGGTEAIKDVITTLPNNAPPIVITQHIPPGFSASFAKRMDSICDVTVQEAQHGQKIKEGNVYIAPGDKHLKVANKGGNLFCILEDSEPVNRHKPAVDVLFESLLDIATNVQAILLTGMGQDGAQGMLELKNSGALTIIQSKDTSVIWGMPGAASLLGAECLTVDLQDISKTMLHYAGLDRKEIKEAMYEF